MKPIVEVRKAREHERCQACHEDATVMLLVGWERVDQANRTSITLCQFHASEVAHELQQHVISNLPERVRPFHSGSQSAEWEGVNCDTCIYIEECAIRNALLIASFEDGTISRHIAYRMGWEGHGKVVAWTWGCPERVADRS